MTAVAHRLQELRGRQPFLHRLLRVTPQGAVVFCEFKCAAGASCLGKFLRHAVEMANRDMRELRELRVGNNPSVVEVRCGGQKRPKRIAYSAGPCAISL